MLGEKTAIVTGGGRGIGKAIAHRFAREGARVVIAEIDVPFGEEAAHEIGVTGGEAIFVHTNVADRNSVEGMVASAVDRFGGVDILINNAVLPSFPYAADIQDLALDAWHELFSVNLDGVLLCSQETAKQMIAQGRGGHIVNISSIMGLLGVPRLSAYQVAKRAVMGLTASMAIELISHGIVVNCIAPCWVDTRWNVETVKTQEWHDKYIKTGRLPIRRQATTDEIAAVTLFFSSDECSYIVGQTLLVDGGLSLTLE